MSHESDQFRRRAVECRNLAKNARNAVDRDSLCALARDLDEEANAMDADEERRRALDDHVDNSIERLKRSQDTLRKSAPDR